MGRTLRTPEQSPPMLSANQEIEPDLHDGGLFLPEEGYHDLQIPTRVYKGKTKVGGAQVNVTMEVPEEIIDPYAAVIAHGYCGPEEAYAGMRNALARNGKVASTYESPRRQEKLAGLNPKHFNKPVRLLRQAFGAAVGETFRLADMYNVDIEDSVDGIGHSMGCRSAALTAERHPEHFRTILLNEGAGLEPHNILTMIKRLGRFASHDLIGTDVKIIAGSVVYVASNPLKAGAEGIAVSGCDIRKNIRNLGEIGIKTAILAGREDSLVPGLRVAEHSGQEIADLFAFYADPNADHLFPQKYPLEAAMAQIQALKLLHNKRPLPILSVHDNKAA